VSVCEPAARTSTSIVRPLAAIDWPSMPALDERTPFRSVAVHVNASAVPTSYDVPFVGAGSAAVIVGPVRSRITFWVVISVLPALSATLTKTV
jgi:hypothetical protein